ncbi:ABC transporter permease [Carboxylicivirga linearis]|uniref:Transport permease protein n=1 Tax=Carboxylicivirga linearis TaxID=1628157 RepID=A0ABS5JXM0_9BACT|nr:ABC transporter permease [Carboxylicivirga linearis]MBS2099086.1 ABC transporter permease [Carboxylicivirga linearis]
MEYANVIKPKDKVFDLRLKEIWSYRDLLVLFVRRDFVSVYKQTILGPAWFFIQPLFTTFIYTFIFGNIADLPADGIPHSLFYLAGITAWNYFATSLTTISDTFVSNSSLFGKVYFPRAVTPLSIVFSNLIQFGLQLLLFLLIYVYYVIIGVPVSISPTLALFPLLVIMMALLSLGLGMTISSMTTKYRDLKFLIKFGIQLAMYGSSVIYPLSEIPEQYKIWVMINPMVGIIETFKYMFFSVGTFSWGLLFYSLVFSVLIFVIGLAIFNKTEKNFMDTV